MTVLTVVFRAAQQGTSIMHLQPQVGADVTYVPHTVFLSIL